MTMAEGEVVSTRAHPRVDASLMVKLKLGGRAVSARAVNLSMAGMCLQGEFHELGDSVMVAIPLPEDTALRKPASRTRLAMMPSTPG